MEKVKVLSSNVLQPKQFNNRSSPTTGESYVFQQTHVKEEPLDRGHESEETLFTTTMSTVGPGGNKLSLNVQGSRKGVVTMARRNARERNRVKQVNQGFQTLRQHIPEGFRLKKMSKVDTLRCALDYIRSLEKVLLDCPSDVPFGPILTQGEGRYLFDQSGIPIGLLEEESGSFVYTEETSGSSVSPSFLQISPTTSLHHKVIEVKVEPSNDQLQNFGDENLET